jgi:hypothetical protein
MVITRIKPQGRLGWLADMFMLPVMFLTQLTIFERLQRTHAWNNKKLDQTELYRIDKRHCCQVVGLPHAVPRWYWSWFPLFHIPVLGGWKEYVVIAPAIEETWFPGWLSDDGAGVSLIPIKGAVRLLLGPKEVLSFGLTETGEQVPVRCVDVGVLGEKGPYRSLPLR